MSEAGAGSTKGYLHAESLSPGRIVYTQCHEAEVVKHDMFGVRPFWVILSQRYGEALLVAASFEV